MPQKKWVRKLALEMMAQNLSSDVDSGEMGGAEEQPFDFVKLASQQRCKAPGCSGKTEVGCKNCLEAAGKEPSSAGILRHIAAPFLTKNETTPRRGAA